MPKTWTFPTTPGAYRSQFPSAGATGWAVWVTKLHPTGNVSFSALIGGSYMLTPRGIATDRDGNIYIGGEGRSATPPQQPFPTTAGAYQRTTRGTDALVFRLNPTGSTLLSSTFFGGTGEDRVNAVDVDADGNVWVGGTTTSTNLPTTPNAYQSTSLAARDQFSTNEGFVARISADCRRLLYSSYIRSTTAGAANDDDVVRGLVVDREGNLYLGGSTYSSGFPLTQGAYGTTSNPGFIMKFDAANALQFSARMPIEMVGIGVDASSVVGIGYTYPAFPIPTVSPTQPNHAGGGQDAVIMRLSMSGSTLEFSTYLGGSGHDDPTAIAMSPSGNATVVGTTSSTDFPVTANAAQPTARPVTAGGGTGASLSARSFLATYVFDQDRDGLLDIWETNGIDIDGDGTVDLTLTGATADHKDLFVEVDYMSVAGAQGHTHDPRLTPAGQALPANPIQQVITAFASAPVTNPDGQTGIRLHVLIDENLTEQATVTFTGAASQFDAIKRGSPVNPCQSGHFGTTADRANQNCAKILRAKRLAYRYAIFGHEHTSQGNGSSGIGELPGNDFMVTLRVRDQAGADFERHATNWAAMFGTTFEAEWTDIVAGTFMHEFGHTLRLTHGGSYIDRRVNCKPNVLSVMNYTRQFNTTGIQAGTTATQTRVNRALDYSRSVLPSLDETALVESLGIAGPTGAFFGYGEDTSGTYKIEGAANPVDWNGQNGIDTNPVVADVNFVAYNRGCQATPNQTLTGFDDWKALVYSFRSSADYDDGASRMTPDTEELTDEDVSAMVSGSRQPVVAITAPAGNARFSSGASIAITATATDPDGSVAKVEFLGDGVVLGEDTTAPYAFTWQNVPDGSHTIRARATDNQNTLGSATIVVHVGCTTSVTSASSSVAFTGGAGTVQVSLGNACTWAAVSNASWLTVTSAFGTGPATVAYSANENTTTDLRTATVTVNETTFTVTQAAAPPFGAPSGLLATALKDPADQPYIYVAWNPVANADYYEVSIQRPSSTFTRITYDRYFILPSTETFADTAYLFKVRAISTSAQTSAYSAPDLATVVFLTDDPIVAGTTHAKAVHITELRPTMNAVRALAALSATSFPTPVAPGGIITATPIMELRKALDPARAALGLTAISYTDPTIGAGTRIKRAHVQEIRDGIK
ncbi:MAG TPA: Ig-like domain-containing protein [Thermoanaerobaculia bacterium]|nr:Ig-like domain-containing protein [Thermoanaerobaculia bacterium]